VGFQFVARGRMHQPGNQDQSEVTGSEDLFVDGVVEGKLSLTTNSCLTIGPNGSVKADVIAREVIVRGKIEGKVTGRTGFNSGAPAKSREKCRRIAWPFEDGAVLRGKVEAGRQTNKTTEIKASAATATGKAADTTP